ncbi:MAG: hypothetical protein BWY72_02108 [Bacteroidetes bacterium ADurb.Bin416]|nr:MAG: hypothetical protein BWY72_02108 [Bacteroidetes bacterium ADurb.Bin416]
MLRETARCYVVFGQEKPIVFTKKTGHDGFNDIPTFLKGGEVAGRYFGKHLAVHVFTSQTVYLSDNLGEVVWMQVHQIDPVVGFIV